MQHKWLMIKKHSDHSISVKYIELFIYLPQHQPYPSPPYTVAMNLSSNVVAMHF